MIQYIDKAKVVAEIESIEYETNYEPFTDEVFGKRMVCKEIKDFIGTLEVKEMDLDEEVNVYMVNEMKFLSDEVGYDTLSTIAKHFFELGMQARKGERV